MGLSTMKKALWEVFRIAGSWGDDFSTRRHREKFRSDW
jgi:hypothetical protein